jgi:hypothetical protein
MKPTPVILAVVALLGAGAYFATRYESPTAAQATPAPVAQAMPTAAPTAAPTATPTAAPVAPQASLSARVDALMRGRPVDALEAFKLLSACAHKQAPCEDISPGQIASRRVALHKAAEAGVHGAARLLIQQGPDDYGLHKIDATDPVFQEADRHVRKALEAGVRTGDPFSITTLAQWAELPTEGNASDLTLALMYWTAMAARNPHPAYAREVARLTKELPPDIAAKAISEGRLIAQSFKPEGEQQ